MSGGTVFFVDDNAAVRKSMSTMLRSEGLRVQTYASAREILNFCPSEDTPGCLILDFKLQRTTGIALYEKLNEKGCYLPFIMLSGVGGVDDATLAMRRGAVDFLQKPASLDSILPAIERAFEIDREAKVKRRRVTEFQRLLAKLTPRERQVLDLVVKGKLTKQIAKVLEIAEKTVDVHRSNITKKVQSKSVVELVRKYVEYQRDSKDFRDIS